MWSPLVLFVFFTFWQFAYAQEAVDDIADDLGVDPEVVVAIGGLALLFTLCCCCFAVFCCCRARQRRSPPRGGSIHDGTDLEEHPGTFAVSSSPRPKAKSPKKKNENTDTFIRQVSAGDLPNDISANEKKKVDNLVLPLQQGQLGGTKKNRTSVKMIAAQGGINPILPAYQNNTAGGQKLYSDTDETEERPNTPSQGKSKAELMKKMERIAQGAAGGVYNTGSSTARLSMDIVKGFDLMREKKKMEQEKAQLGKLEEMAENGMVPATEKPKEPPAYTKVPEGKARLEAFLNEEDRDKA